MDPCNKVNVSAINDVDSKIARFIKQIAVVAIDIKSTAIENINTSKVRWKLQFDGLTKALYFFVHNIQIK